MTRTMQMKRMTQSACVGGVLIATVAASVACGGAPAIVMYDSSLEPIFALQVSDEGGKPIRIGDAFDVDGDVVVTGERIVGEACDSGISDGWFGPLPYHTCYDLMHGFVARIARASGEVKWVLAASGDESASCPVSLTALEGVSGFESRKFRVSASCADGVEIGGRSGSIDEWLDVEDGAFAGENPLPVFPIYDGVAYLEDGSVVTTFDATTERGYLNDDGVIEETIWENVGHEDVSLSGAVHVLDGEVLVAWQDGTLYKEMRFSVIDLADGREIETIVVAAGTATPSASGWWSTSPFSLDGKSAVQHRDRAGAITAERDVPSTHALSGTYEHLWLVDETGPAGATIAITVTLPKETALSGS